MTNQEIVWGMTQAIAEELGVELNRDHSCPAIVLGDDVFLFKVNNNGSAAVGTSNTNLRHTNLFKLVELADPKLVEKMVRIINNYHDRPNQPKTKQQHRD